MMDDGYEGIDASVVDFDSSKEKLYLIRMPHDMDSKTLSKLDLASVLHGSSSSSSNSKKEKKGATTSEHGNDGGLGRGFNLSVDMSSNEKSAFRAVVSGVVDGAGSIGPAFEGVVCINKQLVMPSSSGSGCGSLNEAMRAKLPANKVLSIPGSYQKKDQVKGLKTTYKKGGGASSAGGEESSSVKSPSAGKKRKGAAEIEDGDEQKSEKKKVKKAKKEKKEKR
jgi:hypothetical protein